MSLDSTLIAGGVLALAQLAFVGVTQQRQVTTVQAACPNQSIGTAACAWARS